MSNKPNFFIVGAAKAGTSSLWDYLDQHPQIYMSPIKEPNHFCKDIVYKQCRDDYKRELEIKPGKDLLHYLNGPLDKAHMTHIEKFDDYLKLYKKVDGQKAIGENSNSYLYSQVAAKEIYSMNPDAKIIIMLRNPVERAFSHYLNDLRISFVTGSFEQEVNKDLNSDNYCWGQAYLYYKLGLYYEQVKRYYDVFPAEQIKVYLFDDYKKDSQAILKDIFSFLEVDNTFDCDVSRRLNVAKMPKSIMLNKVLTSLGIKELLRKNLPSSIKAFFKNLAYSSARLPQMTKKEKENLWSVYNKDVENLSSLLGKDLTIWNY